MAHVVDCFPFAKRISRSLGRFCLASIIRNGICRGQNIIGVGGIALAGTTLSPFKIALYAICLRFCAEIILYILGVLNTSVCKSGISVISPVIVQFTDLRRTMQVNHFYAGASAKGIAANIIDPISVGDVCQSGTARKSTFADFRETVREYDACQRVTITEGLITDFCKGCGQRNILQAGASEKCL
nr:hypothetical protein [Agathobaculum hominis]